MSLNGNSHYSHPWETVAQAAWRKYPNPMNPAVIGTDVVDRKVVNGVLHTHRLVGSKWYFPRWTQSVSECIKNSQSNAIIKRTLHPKVAHALRYSKVSTFRAT